MMLIGCPPSTRARQSSARRCAAEEQARGGDSWCSGEQPLDGIRKFASGTLTVELHGGTTAKQRLDLGHVPLDLSSMLRFPAVRVVRSRRNAVEKYAEWCAEQNDVVKAVVEAALVVNRSRHDDLGLPREQGCDASLVPCAVRQCPAVVIGVDNLVPTTRHLIEQRALARARHTCHQHPSHEVTLGPARRNHRRSSAPAQSVVLCVSITPVHSSVCGSRRCRLLGGTCPWSARADPRPSGHRSVPAATVRPAGRKCG